MDQIVLPVCQISSHFSTSGFSFVSRKKP